MSDLWIQHGDFELNYGCACGLPTLRPSPGLEDRLRLRPSDQEPEPAVLTTAVHIHGFHPDGLAVLLDALLALRDRFDLLISTDSSAKRARIESILASHPLRQQAAGPTSVEVLSNLGRNLAPLLVDLHPRLQTYDLVLHLHTKQSPHDSIGARWLAELLESLLGDPAQAASIRLAFGTDPRLGLVMPSTAPTVRGYLNWGSNFEQARLICQQNLPGWHLDPQAPLVFPAGMMFWFRPEALAGLAEACRRLQPLPPEPLPIDGTVLHALERLTAHFCEAAGYHWALCPQALQEPGGEPRTVSERLSVWSPLPDTYMGSISLMAERCRQQSSIASDLAACLADRERQRSEQAREREKLVATIARLEHGISSGEAKLAVLEGELSAMRNSRSWKLTQPLRQLQQRLQDGAGT